MQDRLLFRCLTASFALHVAFVLGVPIRQHMANPSPQPRQIRFSHVKLITLAKPPPEQPKVEVSRQEPKPARTVVRRRLVARHVARQTPRPEKKPETKPPVEVAKAPEKAKLEPPKPAPQVAKLPEPKPIEPAKPAPPPVQVTLLPPPKEGVAAAPSQPVAAGAAAAAAASPGGPPEPAPAPVPRPVAVGGSGIEPDKTPTGALPKATPEMMAALPGTPGSSGRPAGLLTSDTTGPVAATAPAAGSGGGAAPGPATPGPTMVALGPKVGLAPGEMPGPGTGGLPFAGPEKLTPGMGSLTGVPGLQTTPKPAGKLGGTGDGGDPTKLPGTATGGLAGLPGLTGVAGTGVAVGIASAGSGLALGSGITESTYGTRPVPAGKLLPGLLASLPGGTGAGSSGGGGRRAAGGGGGDGGDGGPVGGGGGSGLPGAGGFARGGGEPGAPGIPGARLALAGDGGGGGVPGRLIGYGGGGNGGGIKATPGMLALGPASLPGVGGEGPGGGQGGTGGVGTGTGGGVGDGVGPVAVGGSGPAGQGGILAPGGLAGTNVALGVPTVGGEGGGGGFGGLGGGEGVGGPGTSGTGPGGGGGGRPDGTGTGTGIGKAVPGGGPLVIATGPGGGNGTGQTPGGQGSGNGAGTGIGDGADEGGPVAVIAQGLANLGMTGTGATPGGGGVGAIGGVSLADAGIGPGGKGTGGEGGGAKENPGGLYVDVSGTFDMPRAVASTDFGADPYSMQNLLTEVRKRTNIHVTVAERQVQLAYEDIVNTPILHIRGHRPFTFTAEQRDAIRKYVLNGGTVFGEDSHGPFGDCFRREMKMIFGQDLHDLPTNHELYKSYYVLKNIPAGDMGEKYPLSSINIGNRAGVIFSRNDYGACWDGTGGWVKPETREPAFQMGVNIYAYVVAHWTQDKAKPK